MAKLGDASVYPFHGNDAEEYLSTAGIALHHYLMGQALIGTLASRHKNKDSTIDGAVTDAIEAADMAVDQLEKRLHATQFLEEG